MQPLPDTFIAPQCNDVIKVLYQDDSLLLINKPSGLLSLSGKNPLNKDSVHFRLVQDFPTARLVHRLDFGTSGIMIVALNKVTNAALTQQLQRRSVTKTYTAMLHGLLAEDEGEINFPLIKDKERFPFQKICLNTGKDALSRFSVIERQAHLNRTRVLFTPLTGRTHQLRVHSDAIGHPILGCDLYGTEESFRKASRLMLHADFISFQHPDSGQQIEWKCPTPF